MRHSFTKRFYYSSDEDEIKNLIASGWEQLQRDGYIYETQVEGTSEVYHLYNENTGEGIYTTSPDEKKYWLNPALTHE